LLVLDRRDWSKGKVVVRKGRRKKPKKGEEVSERIGDWEGYPKRRGGKEGR